MNGTIRKLAAMTVFCIFLSGCAAAAIQGVTRASDQARIAVNEDAADRGDVSAQLALGDSHCCTIAGSAGVLNNQKATHWYCRAAVQGAPRAQYELGRIYSGDLVRGINGPATIGSMLTEQREHRPLALMWFTLAEQAGDKSAAKEAASLRKKMSLAEVEEASARLQTWKNQTCEWNEVYAENQL